MLKVMYKGDDVTASVFLNFLFLININTRQVSYFSILIL